MLNAVSIAVVRYNTLCDVNPSQYVEGRSINERTMKKVYEVITKDDKLNIIV